MEAIPDSEPKVFRSNESIKDAIEAGFDISYIPVDVNGVIYKRL